MDSSTDGEKATRRAHRSTDDLIALIDTTDRLPGTVALRARSFDALALSAGDRVVDVGCGPGRAVAELAERGVRAVGVDPDPRMLEVAAERCPAGDFRSAEAYRLPLPDASVDGYRADKVFHELAEPERALAEARRVLVPGGRIVLVGQDWDTIVIDSSDAALTRTIVHARADRVTAPRAARRYRTMLRDAGFDEVRVEVHTAVVTGTVMLPLLTGLAEVARASGAVPREAADGWIAEQLARAASDRLFLALPMFLASATSPG